MADEEIRPDEGINTTQSDIVRRWLIRLVVLVVVFLLGFVPMWWSKRSVVSELDQAKRELRRNQLQNTLSAASLYARRGEYETGRQNASTFFSELQTELDKADSTVLTAQEKSQIPGLLSGRDDVITLLSRSDPASADRLSDMYVAYRAITSVKQPQ
jgi:hypothetical protein